ncbi:class I SAM-dependent methyltransferase [Chitinophaga caseinilytica]|uniref:Class I SAM-dependent methyltransferase n=1 Tax=Chitinophaga caseinilytica TaxID=2267521 RepID=A0ABZ2Z2E7_9BACT
MDQSQKQSHWEKVYREKGPQDVSWTQDKPELSLELIRQTGLGKDAAIIDIGGGDSRLTDWLLEEGYTNITVLDISAAALEKAKARLGEKGAGVKWIASDIDAFEGGSYDIWHDRAAFHFLTTPEQIARYVETAGRSVTGTLIIGTFSETGPEKCSGLPVTRYSETKMTETFAPHFRKNECLTHVHTTPFGTTQDFRFCIFTKTA